MRRLRLAACALVVLAAPAWALEDCDNRADDDGDGLVDCCDSLDCDSFSTWYCRHEAECVDGYDNNCDGYADCADGWCMVNSPACAEVYCSDGVDDEGDGLVDCCDDECWDDSFCSSELPPYCADGIDQDCDGAADCQDYDCLDPWGNFGDCGAADYDGDGVANALDCAWWDPAITSACGEDCSNGADDDGDGMVDWCDPECTSGYESSCTDGFDNNCDGFADCDSLECTWACPDADYDGDGSRNADDCRDDDPSLWRRVPEVTGLMVVPTGTPGVFISWDDMSVIPGVGTVTYDVAYFGRGTCVARNIPDAGVEDTLPGTWSYLVRGENACGSEGWGTDSSGEPREGCP